MSRGYPLTGSPVRRLRRSGLLASIAIAASVQLVLATTVSLAVTTSRPSPFAACTDGASSSGTIFVNAEVEPWLDVNPTNGTNVIGVWQQDRWTDGGAHGLDTAYSTNTGTSWSYPTPIPFSTCAGSTNPNYSRSTDPWVSFGPTGIAYQIALPISGTNDTGAILASRSTDGGASWSSPVTIWDRNDPFDFSDKESITADSTNANNVYAVWDRVSKPGANESPNAGHSFAYRGIPTFSRSTDQGGTWSTPTSMFSTNSNLFTIGNQIVVEPDGTLIDFFDFSKGSGVQPANLHWKAVMRSTDDGASWSKPILISQVTEAVNRIPDGTFRVRAGSDDVAVDPSSGALYAAWTDSRFNDGSHNDIVVSKSTDGGLTWSAPVKASKNPVGVDAFTPSVHVNSSGQVAVTYYDFRNAGAGPTVPTDYWIEISSDGGSSYVESRLTSASFDITTAPVAPASRGYFLGDYEGLSSFGPTFYVLYIKTTGDLANRTDAFFQTVTP